MKKLKFIEVNSKDVRLVNILVMLAYGLGTVAVAYLYLHNLFVSILFFAAGLYMAHFTEIDMRKAEEQRELTEFRDFIDMMNGSMCATSKPVELCVDEALESMSNMSYKKGKIFKELLVMQNNLKTNYKTNFSKEMNRIATVFDNKDIRNFAKSVEACYGVNTGSISDVIKTTSALIQEKRDIDGEIQIMVGEKKCEALIMLIIPPAMLLYYNMCMNDYLAVMYSRSLGFQIMLGCLVANIVAFIMQKKILNSEEI